LKRTSWRTRIFWWVLMGSWGGWVEYNGKGHWLGNCIAVTELTWSFRLRTNPADERAGLFWIFCIKIVTLNFRPIEVSYLTHFILVSGCKVLT
jgi:hypothetical protein